LPLRGAGAFFAAPAAFAVGLVWTFRSVDCLLRNTLLFGKPLHRLVGLAAFRRYRLENKPR